MNPGLAVLSLSLSVSRPGPSEVVILVCTMLALGSFAVLSFDSDPAVRIPKENRQQLDIPRRYFHYFESGIVLVWIT